VEPRKYKTVIREGRERLMTATHGRSEDQPDPQGKQKKGRGWSGSKDSPKPRRPATMQRRKTNPDQVLFGLGAFRTPA